MNSFVIGPVVINTHTIIFHVCLRPGGGWGNPSPQPVRPPLTEKEDRRATETDALQSTTFRLVILDGGVDGADPLFAGTEVEQFFL